MKIKTILIASVLCIYQLHSQNIWGVDANVDLTNAQFQNSFIEIGITGNYPANNWTALSVYSNNGQVTPGLSYWKRNTLGYSQGAYWNDTTPVNSPSQANGIAIFDSDYLDSQGTIGAFGTGTAPTAHKGELISPRMDLTGYTNIPLAVKFYSFYRTFQVSALSVSFSSDDGATWSIGVDYRPLQSQLTQGFITVQFPTTATQNITNLTQCRIKFTFEGDYYFAIIDDVTVQAPGGLSVNQLESNYENYLIAYPNPANDFIRIKKENNQAEDYSIFNILGKEVLSGKLSNNNEIEIKNLQSGIYLIKLSGGKTIKFIKE